GRPGAVRRGLGVHGEFQLGAGGQGVMLPVVAASLERFAVDGEDEIADVELDALLLGRAVPIDVHHLVEAAGVRLQLKARIAGLISRGHPAAAADAGVRGVQLADHLADDIVQLLAVADVVEQRLIHLPHLVPVHAVHVRIVEAMLHDTPAFIENLLALSPMIDLHTGSEVDPPGCGARLRRGARGCRRAAPATAATAPAAGGSPGRSRGRVACWSGTNSNGVDAGALLVEERAAVAGKLQCPRAAEATASARGWPFSFRGLARGLSHAGQALAVDADGPDRLHLP